ncbi:hypothetical protein CPB84DRAFT_1797330 [Gymnopilus junonius]|uniref:Uncharacterized protein n=1 Tax=Gymnopilus junonius TaxID=109634 RepID=A0A9P5N8L2_GYMJU|nr:hypothetical protein CPB84DRAFT_1797330 [Gymnopilus junonius]
MASCALACCPTHVSTFFPSTALITCLRPGVRPVVSRREVGGERRPILSYFNHQPMSLVNPSRPLFLQQQPVLQSKFKLEQLSKFLVR